ncbi:MAG: PorV/PorQ family protein [bacterium]
MNDTLLAQGGRAGAFLRMGVGARAKAMGNAFTALSAGIEMSYYNPAGLPFLQHKEVMASYRALSLDRQFAFVGLGVPIHPGKPKGENRSKAELDGGFALSWIHAGVGNIDGRDSDGQHFGDLSNSENAFIFSFALNPTQLVAVGLSVKVLWNRFPGLGINDETISATGVGFDLGALLRPKEWLTFGITIRDLNSKYTWNSEDLFGENNSQVINKFPTVVRAGVAVKVPKVNGLTLALDFEDSKQLDSRIHIGAEEILEQKYVLRAGFDDGSFTAGAGYHFGILGKMSQINYAYASPGDRPEGEHIFSWVFQF